MIVGTAGHVDHGKSALVTALTGRAMDRLAEEQRRGVTIDLNFAPFPLDDGRVAGIIDVPGHEDYVRTMVAGASGVDLALLVVAADEGIMPQTEEHLLVLERLGVRQGIPVITKADLVDADLLSLVVQYVADRLAESPVAFERPIPVSVRSGQGLDAVRTTLGRLLAAAPPRERDDLFRLPVDRSFSAAGVGTVVTGTCWSGSIEPGADARVLPGNAHGRIRSVEAYGVAIAAAEPGARTALGIAGLARTDAPRGVVVVAADSPWETSRVLDCELGLDRGEPLRRRTRLRVHLATADVSGWALPRAAIDPGGTGLVRLLLDRPIVARGGDRFVVRSLSPAAVIGGGIVLDPLPERHSPWLAGLTANDPSERIQALVARRRQGLPITIAPVVAGLPRRALARALREQERLRRIGEYLVDEAVMHVARMRAGAAIEAYHAEHPADRGMPLESLRRAASTAEWISDATISGMRQRGDIIVQDGLAAARGFRPRVEGGDAIVARVTAELERAGLAPPSVDELAASFGRPDMPAILRLASASGAVEALERDRYFARTALEGFVRAVRDAGEHSEVTVAGLREMLGLSRKYLIPLLEWADRRGLTVRTGDTRRLRPAPGEPGRAR